ncbi:hypothetical protein [uncultured Kordia sp.]|uniref:hypothetical protein n=1 Tax=uncultured Kordia sp. TaxID=507699 RepID=UPI00261AA2D9|nr:hypothetical protein [uncultured Kordia sp.]
MKKHLKKLSLNKKQVSQLGQDSLKGGFTLPWQTPTRSCFGCEGPTTGQTGSLCLTGNQTNCQ